MSILESMRSETDSSFMQIVFALIVVSFVAWGLAPTGERYATVATVNGQTINSVDFQRAYGQYERQREDAIGRPLNQQERDQLQVDVVDQLIQRAAVLQKAKDMGLVVSETEVAKELLQYDFLKSSEGMFDQRLYRNFLSRSRMTKSDFEAEIRDQLLLAKLSQLVGLGASVSEPALQAAFVDASSTIDLSYVRLTPVNFFGLINPSTDEIEAWASQHEDDVTARYNERLSSKYDRPEQVSLSAIEMNVGVDGLSAADLKPRLENIKGEIEGGADFAAMAAEHSNASDAVEGGQRGFTVVADLPEKLRDAVAPLQPGELSKVVVYPDKVALYRVDAREEARVIPLDEVRTDLALEMMREEMAPARAADAAQDVLASWNELGTPSGELLLQENLRMQRTGPIKASGSAAGLFPPPPSMLKDARAADEGAILPEVYDAGDALWIGQLDARTEADMTEFEENKEQLYEMTLGQRRVAFGQGWVDSVVAEAVVTRN